MGQKETPEPNLHVYGEDGTKKVVYKLKEEPVRKGGGGTKKNTRKHRWREKKKKGNKRTISTDKREKRS